MDPTCSKAVILREELDQYLNPSFIMPTRFNLPSQHRNTSFLSKSAALTGKLEVRYVHDLFYLAHILRAVLFYLTESSQNRWRMRTSWLLASCDTTVHMIKPRIYTYRPKWIILMSGFDKIFYISLSWFGINIPMFDVALPLPLKSTNSGKSCHKVCLFVFYSKTRFHQILGFSLKGRMTVHYGEIYWLVTIFYLFFISVFSSSDT